VQEALKRLYVQDSAEEDGAEGMGYVTKKTTGVFPTLKSVKKLSREESKNALIKTRK